MNPTLTRADDRSADTEIVSATRVEELVAKAAPSVAVIHTEARDGQTRGIGTGFVISPDGLIATNLHVIGQGRPITVEFADGKRHDVVSVHASDRSHDLAVIRIDARDRPALPLGDSDALKSGRPVIALGNPLGLEHSVVSGVVSAVRAIDGTPMIQLAIPIESGNSGGPLLDLEGRVHGILTMKSAVTANLGFAVAINSLKPLIEKPNPIPIARWLRIGSLDPARWTVLFNARWQQRAGRISVQGVGKSFGGRSLCLATDPVPDRPFEAAVTVQLDDEAGAAGLAFDADGGNKHYAFYPSNGRLRLTCFEGPDIYSWTILAEVQSEHYRPGRWNRLRVRREDGRIRCFVNGKLAIESDDDRLPGGKVGLVKFRGTVADFKDFRVGKNLAEGGLSAEQIAQVTDRLDGVGLAERFDAQLVTELAETAPESVTILRDRALHLQQRATRLEELAEIVHQKSVQKELAEAVHTEGRRIDLFRTALLIAKLDDADVDVDAYLDHVAAMAREIRQTLPDPCDEADKLAALNRYLFQENGFHGSRHDYYSFANSYMNKVLDDREGLPITLSVLYMELARRIGLKIDGVGLPGHFVVRHVPGMGPAGLIDVFNNGKPLPRTEAAALVHSITGRRLRDDHLASASTPAILVRILRNLLGLARQDRDFDRMLRYLDTILVITPDSADEHWTRAVLRFQVGDRPGALADCDWLLERQPETIDLHRVADFRRMIAAAVR